MEPEPCLWLLCSGAAVVGACPAPSRSSSGLGRSEGVVALGTHLQGLSSTWEATVTRAATVPRAPILHSHWPHSLWFGETPEAPAFGTHELRQSHEAPNGWSRLGEALKLVDRTFCGARRVQCPPPAPPWHLTPTQDSPCLSEPGPCAMPGLTRPQGPHSACTGGWRLAGPRCAQV